MKNNILFGFLILLTFNLWAQDPVYTKAELQEVRVYYNGAELTAQAQVELPKGFSQVVISNIANQLSENTLQIGSSPNVTIMSVQFTNAYVKEYGNPENSPLTQPLRDSIALVELALEKMTNAIQADQHTVQLLDSNLKSEDKALNLNSVEAMKAWIAYYKNKRQELQTGIYLKKQKKEKIVRKLERLKSQLKLGGSTKISKGKLIVQVMNKTAGEVPFHINYLTQKARWIPSYDLRITAVGEPVQMTYKAQVTQNSGLDWHQVNLSLTSGTVNQNNTLPEWHNWFIGYAASSKKISRETLLYTRPNIQASQKLQSPSTAYQTQNSIDRYTAIKDNQLNLTFDISIPYTILSNGKKHSVDLKNFQLEGDYKYYSAPKMDLNAYLVVNISDYAQYNLLPGNANIIFDGMYVGKTHISPQNTKQDLRLNLGRDPEVSVNRVLMKDKSQTKILSTKKERRFVYEITVKNNKAKAINIQVEDQFPLSKNTDIDVNLTETSGAQVNRKTGLLTWKLSLAPGQSKTLQFGYTVRFDKDKNIVGL